MKTKIGFTNLSIYLFIYLFFLSSVLVTKNLAKSLPFLFFGEICNFEFLFLAKLRQWKNKMPLSIEMSGGLIFARMT
jgi:hypothetical protein